MIADRSRRGISQHSSVGFALLAFVLVAALLNFGCAGLAGSNYKQPPPGNLTISNPAASAITTTSVTVTWQTNVPANSQIEYGIGTTYGSTTSLDSAMVTSHQETMSNLKPGTLYYYRLHSADANNNQAASAGLTVTTSSDTTPPTVSITAPAAGATVTGTITVSASAADNIAVASVQFRVDGTNNGSAKTSAPYNLSLNTATLTNGSHTLTAVATDTSGNSATSAGVTVTSSNVPDTTPPSVPTGLTATATSSSQISLSWTASTDNVAVTGYKVFRGGSQIGTSTSTSFPDSGLLSSTTYTYTVSAFDAAGNNSAQSASASATTKAPDTTPPSVPTGLGATATSPSQINLSWTASTDNVGVTGYDVFRNGTKVATTGAASFSDAGLSASTTYTYTVDAFDAAGNTSAQSSSASATTLSSGGGLPSSLGWYQIPNTAYQAVCPTYPDIQGQSGCAAVANAWGSGWADTKRNRMVLFGGGHTDYFGNEVYVLDLNANPINISLGRDATHGSALTGPSACGDANADGTPNSRHDNDGMDYLSNEDLYFIHGGNLANCGSFTNNYWTLNPSAMAWTHPSLPSNAPNPGQNGSSTTLAYDSVSDKVYMVETNANTFWQWDPASNVWTVLNGNIGGACDTHGYEHTSVIDPGRRAYFCFGVGDAYKISLNAPYAATSLAMNNCGTIKSDTGPGAAYDSVQKLIVAWSGGNTVYQYNPDTDSCTAVTYSGGPGAQQNSGTYKRFSYFPSLGVFVLINNSSQNAYALRLTPPSASANDANFAARRAAPGVIASMGWDASSDFVEQTDGTKTGFSYQRGCPTWPTPCIRQDTSVFLSGGSSARWDIYTNTDSDAEGYWFQTFGQTFAQNSTFYIQFAFRADTNWVTTDWTQTGTSGAGTSPKILIAHGVDANGQPVTCDNVQFVFRNENAWALPDMYSQCGQISAFTDAGGVNYFEGSTSLYQQGFTAPAPFTGYDCAYNHGNKPVGNCLFFQADTWYTVYLKLHIGTWGQPNSTVEAWAAPYGQQLKKMVNVMNYTMNSSSVAGFSGVTLTQFMTGKQASAAHPTAHVWYDELIISTQSIPAPASQTP